MTIAVITPMLPERHLFLCEAIDSVCRQTLVRDWHLIALDSSRQGGSAMRNHLCLGTSADWVAPLDDDDYFLPNHLASLIASSTEADVVYSRCRVIGREGWDPSGPFDPDRLRQGNFISVTTLIRRSLVLELNGWRKRDECPNGFVDWDLWLRALDIGARFVYVPEVTWVYRLHANSQTVLWAASGQ
jgi:glycosyltransferase involved in cell wall biosynthesis